MAERSTDLHGPPRTVYDVVLLRPYTFSVKPKWRTVVFWFFVARSSAEAYLRTSPPRRHSTAGVPKRCRLSIWLRAHEEFSTPLSIYRLYIPGHCCTCGRSPRERLPEMNFEAMADAWRILMLCFLSHECFAQRKCLDYMIESV